MFLFGAPLILTHFWPASTLLRGHLALATLSPPETNPQILERWGYADEDHLGKSFQAMDFGLACQRDVQQAFVNFTRWIGFEDAKSIDNPVTSTSKTERPNTRLRES